MCQISVWPSFASRTVSIWIFKIIHRKTLNIFTLSNTISESDIIPHDFSIELVNTWLNASYTVKGQMTVAALTESQ